MREHTVEPTDPKSAKSHLFIVQIKTHHTTIVDATAFLWIVRVIEAEARLTRGQLVVLVHPDDEAGFEFRCAFKFSYLHIPPPPQAPPTTQRKRSTPCNADCAHNNTPGAWTYMFLRQYPRLCQNTALFPSRLMACVKSANAS